MFYPYNYLFSMLKVKTCFCKKLNEARERKKKAGKARKSEGTQWEREKELFFQIQNVRLTL